MGWVRVMEREKKLEGNNEGWGDGLMDGEGES